MARLVLDEALRLLREHEPDLRARGVLHAGVFGSVARGTARRESDIDVLVELDPDKMVGLFGYTELKLFIAGLFGAQSLDESVDVVNRATLKPWARSSILRDVVHAF